MVKQSVSWRISDVAHATMLRQEKFLQQPVDLQQGLAVEQHVVPFDGEKVPILQPLQRRGEFFSEFDTKFFSEIGTAHVAELELENEFANKPFLVRRRERAVNRQLALLQTRDVRLEIMVVLIMHAANMAKRSDAQRKQVRPGPQTVAVD